MKGPFVLIGGREASGVSHVFEQDFIAFMVVRDLGVLPRSLPFGGILHDGISVGPKHAFAQCFAVPLRGLTALM